MIFLNINNLNVSIEGKKILNDLKQEYISKEYVEKHYPQFKS